MELGQLVVSLNVQDIRRSLEFYQTLGFEVADGSVESRFLTLKKGDCHIGLYQGHLDPAETQLIFWQGDVAAIASDLKDQGITFERGPSRDVKGGVSALLRDPDGHPLYFINMPELSKGS